MPFDPNNNAAIGFPKQSYGIETGLISAITVAIANAAPGAVATFGIGGITAISQAVVAGAFLGGTAALSGAFSADRSSTVSPQITKNTYEGEDGPRYVVLGRARIGGTWGFRASTTGYDTYRLLWQCQGQIDGVEENYANDKIVIVDPSGTVTSSPYVWSESDGGLTGGVSQTNYFWIFNRLGGTPSSAFSQLTSDFPDTWTTSHRGDGVAACLSRFRSPGVSSSRYLVLWPSGFPTVNRLLRGPVWYDPRDDTSRWSDNGVLGLFHYLTNSVEEGGMGLSQDIFDLDDIAFAADDADESVSSLSGSEVRSKCSGAYTMDTARGQIAADIMLSTGTQIVNLQNGKYGIRLVDDNPTPTTYIKNKDVQSITWGGEDLVSDANKVSVSYLSPERDWQMADIDLSGATWAVDQDSIDRTGERIQKYKLLFCPQSGQAQRIVRRLFNRVRSTKGTIVTGPSGMFSMGHIAGNVEVPDLGDDYAPDVELGLPTFDFAAKTLSIPVTYLDTPLATWNAATHEQAAPKSIADIQYSGTLDAPTISSSKLWAVQYDGDPELRFSWSSVSGADAYEASYRIYDGIKYDPRLPIIEINSNRYAYSSSPITIGENYEAEVRGYKFQGQPGKFSDKVYEEAIAYDTTAPSGCSVDLTLDVDPDPPSSGSQREYTLSATSTSMNICQIDVGDGYVYVRPYETITKTLYTTYTTSWPAAPTGTVNFRGGNTSGSLTSIGY